MTDYRLEKIYDAAARLFINYGYSRTQISPIAKDAGISVGAVYTLFTGKKAILDFILKCNLNPSYIESDIKLPIDETTLSDYQNEFKTVFEQNNLKFTLPLQNNSPDYHFEQLLSDAYDIISRYGTSFLIIENNPMDCGKLTDYYLQYRHKFYEIFLAYINLYISKKEIRELECPELSVRLIIETLSWWGMHVWFDAYELRENITKEIAKAVCLDALVNAYKK